GTSATPERLFRPASEPLGEKSSQISVRDLGERLGGRGPRLLDRTECARPEPLDLSTLEARAGACGHIRLSNCHRGGRVAFHLRLSAAPRALPGLAPHADPMG